MTQNGKLMPNLDQESTKVLNLTVLRRIDPFVEEILTTAAHVTFYEFNIEHSRWSRKDVEGSLFVVKRNTQPRFQFIVMNRRNTDNLVENLLGDFEYEVQGPYLLYKNAAQEVNGIWFYNARECEEVANLFNRILNAYSKVPPKPKVSSSKSEFEELEAVPTKNVLEGPLEPLPSSTSTIADVPDDSFVNYFSMAINMGASSNSAVPLQPHPPASTLAPSSHSVATIPSPMPVPSVPSPPLPAASTPLVSVLDASDAITNRVTNLVKPSSFFGPSSSSMLVMPTLTSSTPTAPPLQPPINLQRPYGSPILQPFPPPTPPPSLTANNGTIITREQVCDALMRLVQNNQFIDLLYRELLNAHYS